MLRCSHLNRALCLKGKFMIHWFTTVFSQPAQKAQLFSIVLSAFVAFSVLLLNQWFTSRRARKDHMINKIEEFYEAIGEYEKCAFELFNTMFAQSEDSSQFQEVLDRLQTAVQRVEMYVGLHFPEINFDSKAHTKLMQTAYYNLSYAKASRSGYGNNDSIHKMDSVNQLLDKVRENTSHIKTDAQALMKRHKH
ncbi:hypothetical protein ND930_24725 [Vibrio diabolicus]|nr:hypothetical protein [Vibrio diabolicus]